MTSPREAAIERFRETFKCINSQCDGNGAIPTREIEGGGWEVEQCQFCFEYLMKMEAFLLQEIDRTERETVERCIAEVYDVRAGYTDFELLAQGKHQPHQTTLEVLTETVAAIQSLTNPDKTV